MRFCSVAAAAVAARAPYGFDLVGAEGAVLSPPPEPRETGSEQLGCELLGGGGLYVLGDEEGMVPAHGSLFQRPDEWQPP